MINRYQQVNNSNYHYEQKHHHISKLTTMMRFREQVVLISIRCSNSN
uniref:Uncharacterized protein n=1 Tax=Arundo donax TaxID=35708 RepID=A0A0A9BNC8_ARUDO